MSLFSTPRLRAFTFGLLAVPAVLLGTTLTGCDASGPDSPSQANAAPTTEALTVQAPQAALDGETLFTGLFFGEGDGADYLPEIWESEALANHEPTAEQAKMTSFIVEQVERQSPGFFTSFGRQMQSGSPLQVQAAFDAASEELTRALMAHPDPAIKAAILGGMSDGAASAAGEVEEECAAVLAFWLLLAIVKFVVVPLTEDGGSSVRVADVSQFAGLQRDQLIHDLSVRLAPQAIATR